MFKKRTEIMIFITLAVLVLRLLFGGLNFGFFDWLEFPYTLIYINQALNFLNAIFISVLLVLLLMDHIDHKLFYIYFGVGVFVQLLHLGFWIFSNVDAYGLFSGLISLGIAIVPLVAIYMWDKFQHNMAMTLFGIHMSFIVLSTLWATLIGFGGLRFTFFMLLASILIDVVMILILSDIKEGRVNVEDVYKRIEEEYQEIEEISSDIEEIKY